ncbi:uncharacterized protein LOC106174825 [Lingula anatina]|uniref:Uncharacterized protein LOC106174825 n=1 Tax=Lingula anatina TaxID=7574 RepID=A0A1S3JNP5_LINAN|nr:uncharacterized protein LOC106174825 [Lingula anatina]|eukprot:XP_013411972.1 uncharacterized protein LOC106174825 [Lingula anatina]
MAQNEAAPNPGEVFGQFETGQQFLKVFSKIMSSRAYLEKTVSETYQRWAENTYYELHRVPLTNGSQSDQDYQRAVDMMVNLAREQSDAHYRSYMMITEVDKSPLSLLNSFQNDTYQSDGRPLSAIDPKETKNHFKARIQQLNRRQREMIKKVTKAREEFIKMNAKCEDCREALRKLRLRRSYPAAKEEAIVEQLHGREAKMDVAFSVYESRQKSLDELQVEFLKEMGNIASDIMEKEIVRLQVMKMALQKVINAIDIPNRQNRAHWRNLQRQVNSVIISGKTNGQSIPVDNKEEVTSSYEDLADEAIGGAEPNEVDEQVDTKRLVVPLHEKYSKPKEKGKHKPKEPKSPRRSPVAPLAQPLKEKEEPLTFEWHRPEAAKEATKVQHVERGAHALRKLDQDIMKLIDVEE